MWPFDKPKKPDCVYEYEVVKTVKLRLTEEEFNALDDLTGHGIRKVKMTVEEHDDTCGCGRTITFRRVGDE